MTLSRRRFLHVAAGTAMLPAVCPVASAQTYPTRPVTRVVPVAAGGGIDTAARILAGPLQERLKLWVVV
jgi:tripartite-type tricarboxylate transporter receptor subunit TctC